MLAETTDILRIVIRRSRARRWSPSVDSRLSSGDHGAVQTRVPTMSTLSTAARHAWAISPLGRGLEQYDGLPATLVADGPHQRLTRFDRDSPATQPRPVLLVPPLAVSVRCFDLRPGQSLAAHLLAAGRSVYQLDYGRITFADRAMGFESWTDDIVPTAIRRVLADHGEADGVDLVGWSLGGTISLLTAAAHPDLPISSLTAFGTPVDYRRIPAIQPLVLADRLLGSRVVTRPTAALGGVPAPLVQIAYRAMAAQREVTKPLHLARNILDAETLARTGAIDGFIREMPGYPGRAYHQIHTRLMVHNDLASGTVHLSRDRALDLRAIRTRVLFIGSATDNIANGPAVAAGADVVPGARYAAADGLSHLGLVAGPRASQVSWPTMDAFLEA